MDEVLYHIAGGLTDAQLDELHATVLRVLEEVGVQVGVRRLLELTAGEPGMRVEGSRVRFEPLLIERTVAAHRRLARPSQTDAGLSIDVLTGFAFRDLDPFSGMLRPMTTPVCIEMARLVDALHGRGVRGGTPGLPQDVAPQLREILAYKIGVEHSRTAAHVGVSGQRGAEIIYEMSRVSGLPFGLPVFVLSPLRIEGASIEMALDFLERGLDVHAELTGMPILGLTAPLSVPGAFVEHVATVLAAYTLFDLAGLAERLQCHFAVYPFDMKYGTIAYGTPAHVLAHLVGRQVNAYYGAPTDVCKAFHTNAARPDAHSITQRAAFGALAVLAGARRFTFGGMLGIDMIFSAEQLVVDVEIVDYLRHIARGADWPGGDAVFATLREVGPGGDFLTHGSTLSGYRDLWVSDLFEDLSVEQIDQRREASLQERIRERVRDLLAAEPYQPDRAVVRELDRIYSAAVKELG